MEVEGNYTDGILFSYTRLENKLSNCRLLIHRQACEKYKTSPNNFSQYNQPSLDLRKYQSSRTDTASTVPHASLRLTFIPQQHLSQFVFRVNNESLYSGKYKLDTYSVTIIFVTFTSSKNSLNGPIIQTGTTIYACTSEV